MSYRIGFCPQCDCQIMIRDSKGNLNGFKQNFRQADITFSVGTKVRTIICEQCLAQPDFEKLIAAIVCPKSEACEENVANHIKELGAPISIILASKAKQGIRFPVQ